MQLFAQQTSVVLKSNAPDLLFQATINKLLVNSKYVNDLKITGMVPQGKYTLELILQNDTHIFKIPLTILDDGFCHYYQVTPKGVFLTKIAPDYEVLTDNQTILKFGAPALVDTVIKKDTIKTNLTEHYQMPDYNGKVGCPWPIKDDEFKSFKLNLNNQRLEDDKLAYCKEYLAQACLISKQVAEVLAVFEYEESKLIFAKFIYPRTFDVDNFLPETRKFFKFENSIDQLKKEFEIEVKND